MYTIAQYAKPSGLGISPLTLAGQGEIIGGYPSPLSIVNRPASPPGNGVAGVLPMGAYMFMPHSMPPGQPLTLAGQGERVGGFPSPLSLAMRTAPAAAPAAATGAGALNAAQAVAGAPAAAATAAGLVAPAGGAAASAGRLASLASKVLGSPATALAPAAFQTALGVGQLLLAALKRKPDRPVYSIPEGIKASAAEAQQLAQGISPATRLGLQEARQAFGDTNAMLRRNVGQAASIAALIGATQANTNREIRNLTLIEQQQRLARQQLLDQNRRVLAQYKDKAFQINKMQPYQDAMRTIAALTQGGLLNLNTGLQTAAGAAENIMTVRALMGGGVPQWILGNAPNGVSYINYLKLGG